MSQELTFEQSMARLEQIVAQMEQGDVTLEDSLHLFEEGARLAAALHVQLDKAEQRVSLMNQAADGTIEPVPFTQQEDTE